MNQGFTSEWLKEREAKGFIKELRGGRTKVEPPAQRPTEPILATLGGESPAERIKTALTMSPTTDEAKLNKLETAWLAVLRANKDLVWVGVQNLTLKLADDCRFTPDFTSINSAGKLTAWETKGFMRGDAQVKLKVAARLFPWIAFVLVEKKKGAFVCTETKP